jgi:hypothetical protein
MRTNIFSPFDGKQKNQMKKQNNLEVDLEGCEKKKKKANFLHQQTSCNPQNIAFLPSVTPKI